MVVDGARGGDKTASDPLSDGYLAHSDDVRDLIRQAPHVIVGLLQAFA